MNDLLNDSGGNSNKRHRWSYKECYELAKAYKCSADFKEGNPKAYKAATTHHWLKEFTWFVPHYRSIKWTYDTCYEEARKFSSRKEFQDNSAGAYRKALQQGWLDDYDWMVLAAKPKGYWNSYERVQEEAKKYSSRTEFYKGNQVAYNIALKNGWIDDFIPLKLDVNAKIRCVYSYEFPDYNVAYVGITMDKKRRHLQHKGVSTTGKSASAVLKFITTHKIDIPNPIYWYDNCTVAEAQEFENRIVEYYSEQGWGLLNKAKTGVGHGGIGVMDLKWTKENCYNEAKKYNSRTEFSNNCQSAYAKALRSGWINDYTWFSTLGNKKWTYETCYNEALKYNTRWDFGRGNHPAYQVASQNKWLDDYYWFVKPAPKVAPRKWSYDACKTAAKNCSSRSEFVRLYKGAYEVSRKNGWLDEFIPEKMLNQYSRRTNDSSQTSIQFDVI